MPFSTRVWNAIIDSQMWKVMSPNAQTVSWYSFWWDVYIQDEDKEKIMLTASTSIIDNILTVADRWDLRMNSLESFLLTDCPILTITYGEDSRIIKSVKLTEDWLIIAVILVCVSIIVDLRIFSLFHFIHSYIHLYIVIRRMYLKHYYKS